MGLGVRAGANGALKIKFYTLDSMQVEGRKIENWKDFENGYLEAP